MRVSNQMMANRIKVNLNRQTSQMFKVQERIVTGKKINRPSDDPVGIGEALNYRKIISNMEQYGENIEKAKIHIDTVELILDTVTDFLSDAKEIAFDPNVDMRDSFAEDISTIRQQVLQMANSQMNGNYIFGGNLTDTEPFVEAAGVVSYAGDNDAKDYMVGENLIIDIQADGNNIFMGADDIFDVLADLETALLADDTANITGQITRIESALDQLETVRVENAGRSHRLTATKNYYDHYKVNMQDMLSQTEDADMAESIIDLQVQQVAYESTLATSAKMVTRSLVDFIS
ncbi:MAG: flagellar hook-associated protein 3 [Desulfobacteraceae bacterium]|nr:flagellar hook-associated protein 3 [Desulfobacteraceae bacterium]